MTKKTKKTKRVCKMSAADRKAWGKKMKAAKAAKAKNKNPAQLEKKPSKHQKNSKSLLVGKALSLAYLDPDGRAFTHSFDTEPPVFFQAGKLQIPAHYNEKIGIEDSASAQNPRGKSYIESFFSKHIRNRKKFRDLTLSQSIRLLNDKFWEKHGVHFDNPVSAKKIFRKMRKDKKNFPTYNSIVKYLLKNAEPVGMA